MPTRCTLMFFCLGLAVAPAAVPSPPAAASCRVMDSRVVRLAIVRDRSFLHHPRHPVELWMTAALEDARLGCDAFVSVKMFPMTPADALITTGSAAHPYDGFIVTSRRCLDADHLMSSITRTPILRLDLSPCPPRPGDERLDLSESRGRCAQYALNRWFQHNICPPSDPDTLTWLNRSTFQINEALQECGGQAELLGRPDGPPIHLTSLERPPFVITGERHPNGTITRYTGYCYEMIHTLQDIYKFTYQVEPPKDGTYGTELVNGSWNGMIGMIVDRKADIAVGPISVTYSRAQQVDFTVAFFEEPAAILVPPPTEDTRLLACTRPFQLQVWLCLMLVAALLPLILWQHLEFLWRHRQRPPSPVANVNRRRPGLAQLYFFVLGILVAQPGRRISSMGLSPRLLAAVWSLSAVVLMSAYGGILTSFLSLPKLRPIITSLEDLARSHLSWGVRRGTALESLFTGATTGVYKAIGESLIKKPEWLVDREVDAIERTANGTYAYIKEKSFLEFALGEDYMSSGRCRLGLLADEEFYKVNFAFALQKGSRLKPLLDRKILQMMEAGLGERWKRMYRSSSNAVRKCGDIRQRNAARETMSLGLRDLQGAFVIWAVGSAVAALAFVVERCCSFFGRHRLVIELSITSI